jgi:hypothetical protein
MNPQEVAKLVKRRGSENIEESLLAQLDSRKPDILAFGEINHTSPSVRNSITGLAGELFERGFTAAALEFYADFDVAMAQFNASGNIDALGNVVCPRTRAIGEHGLLCCKNRFVFDSWDLDNEPGFVDDCANMLQALQRTGMGSFCVDSAKGAPPADRDEYMSQRIHARNEHMLWLGGAAHTKRRATQVESAAERISSIGRCLFTVVGLVRLDGYPEPLKPLMDTVELELVLDELRRPLFVNFSDVPELNDVPIYRSGNESQLFEYWDAVILYP